MKYNIIIGGKKNMKKNIGTGKIWEAYKRAEQTSLKSGKGTGAKLGISNSEIREVIRGLLKEQDRVLLASIARVLAEEYHEKKDVFKTRVRVMGAVRAKSSGLELVKEEGRVWIRRR